MAFHEVEPHFAKRCGLKVVFLVDVLETNPTPCDLVLLSSEVKRDEMCALLKEPQEGGCSIHALAGDPGAPLSGFHPLETGRARDAVDLDTPARMMRRSMTNLTRTREGR